MDASRDGFCTNTPRRHMGKPLSWRLLRFAVVVSGMMLVLVGEVVQKKDGRSPARCCASTPRRQLSDRSSGAEGVRHLGKLSDVGVVDEAAQKRMGAVQPGAVHHNTLWTVVRPLS